MAHNIGKTIATLRRANGWTQVALAEKLGVSDKAVSKWENGGGYPEITQLPTLAEIFGVTIDYIMTGKSPYPEIIFMSKAEYCAKTDNAALAREIDLKTTDENGKTLTDYIVEYDCPSVFLEICNRADFEFDYNKYDLNKLYRYALITNQTHILDKYTFKKHKIKCDTGTPYRRSQWFILTGELFDLIATDERISRDTMSYLLSKEYAGQKLTYIAWYETLPHLIHKCYLYEKWGLLDFILDKSLENNSYVCDKKITIIPRKEYQIKTKYSVKNVIEPGSNPFGKSSVIIDGEKHYFVKILKRTLSLAESRGDSHYLEMFNKINYLTTPRECNN